MNGSAATATTNSPLFPNRFSRKTNRSVSPMWAATAVLVGTLPLYAVAKVHADPPAVKPLASTAPRAPLPLAAPSLPMKPLPEASTISSEPGVLLARGAAYARLGDYSRALDAYADALKKQPRDANVLVARAQAALRRAKAAESIKAADLTLRAHPDDIHTRLHRAFAYYNTGDYQKAITDYDALLDTNPDYAAAYLGRALAHVATESWGDAAADYRRAFLLRPDLLPPTPQPSDLHLLVERE